LEFRVPAEALSGWGVVSARQTIMPPCLRLLRSQ